MGDHYFITLLRGQQRAVSGGGSSTDSASMLAMLSSHGFFFFNPITLDGSVTKALLCESLRQSIDLLRLFRQVKMGSNIARRVGTLNYLEFWETSYFIGIMCGIGALVLLIIVIIIMCRCCRRKKMKASKRQSQMNLVQKPSTGNGATQNQYCECE